MNPHLKDISKAPLMKGPKIASVGDQTVCLGMEFKKETKVILSRQRLREIRNPCFIFERNPPIQATEKVGIDKGVTRFPSKVEFFLEIQPSKRSHFRRRWE
jgi:hypothetical protein